MFGFCTINELSKRNKIEVNKTKFERNLWTRNYKWRKSNFTKTTNVYEFEWDSC